MSYKNSVKLFASNFMLVWKQLLYLFICSILFFACAYTTGKPIIHVLSSNGIFSDIKVFVETVYNSPSEIALNLNILLKSILNVVFVENFSTIWLSFVSLIILCLFLPYMLVQISYFNISSILYQKLSMNMNVGYIQNGMRNLGKGIIYALVNIIFSLPFLALSVLLIVIYLTLATTILSSIIGLVILSLLLIIATSIKYSIFTCYTGFMVEQNMSPFVAFGKGFVLVFKNFWKILSTSIAVTLTLILINGFIALFTFFAGTIVTIPASMVFMSIFYMVVYFNSKGERYYLNNNYIFNPVKYTIKQDEVTIIEIPEKQKKQANSKSTSKPSKENKTKSKTKSENKE